AVSAALFGFHLDRVSRGMSSRPCCPAPYTSFVRYSGQAPTCARSLCSFALRRPLTRKRVSPRIRSPLLSHATRLLGDCAKPADAEKAPDPAKGRGNTDRHCSYRETVPAADQGGCPNSQAPG